MRMKYERVSKKELKGYAEGRRPVGRARGRRLDVVGKDSKRKLKCKN
jgi:hypothetical protein